MKKSTTKKTYVLDNIRKMNGFFTRKMLGILNINILGDGMSWKEFIIEEIMI